uniref:Alpha/beta hydrolase fold-3 domain-containing protein n=1 Tax=Picea sitchensis TaxID=3332 RepID=D5A7X7_PICSI|nr:unknown [Picea sitchensis]
MSQVQTPASSSSEILISRDAKPASFPLGLRLLCRILNSVNDLARRKDGTFNRRIMNWIEYKTPANGTPTRGVYTKDVVIDAQTGVQVRLFIPVEAPEKPLPVVFFFHGGGFATLSSEFVLYDIFCRRLARRRRVLVISVDYRRSPEHRFPIPYDDCVGAIRWFSSGNGKAHLPAHADLSRCFLMGDSAGANIVHHVGCRVLAAAEETMSGVRIVGHVLLQPFFGGEKRTPSEARLVGAPIVNMENSDWHWKAFLPVGADRDHPAANVFGPNAPDISALPLPPTLVVVGGHDPLQDWQLGYVEHLRKIKKDVELLFYGEGIHGFHVFYQIEVSSKLISELRSFMTRCCEK